MSNSSGDSGPDVVKAAEPRGAANSSDRGDGGPAKAGPKRPPRPGAGVRPEGAGDEPRPAKPNARDGRPVGTKAGDAKTADAKPATKKSSDGKPGDRAPGTKTPTAKKPGDRTSDTSRPPLRRRSEPVEGLPPGSDEGTASSATAREEAPAARKSSGSSRAVAGTTVAGGSDRDATHQTPRADGSRAPTSRADGRLDAPAQPRPATTGAPAARRRGRRVKRVIRRIELWSVLKLSLVLLTCLYFAVLVTLVVIWNIAYSSGQIENLQKFLADVGLENYRFYGDRMFKACAAIGAVGVLAGTIMAVITTALVNLISEMTGGIRLVVIEEDPPPRR